jgi:ribosomal protein S18 acetylase RimI-like enzyme
MSEVPGGWAQPGDSTGGEPSGLLGLTVRRARPDELDEVGAITVEAYLEDGFLDPDDDYRAELADARRRAEEAEVWVAVQDDQVLGAVTYCTSGTSFAELARPGEGEFRMLAVSAKARRRGVARALVLRCVERSQELGHDALVLSSMAEMSAAHRLYQRLGFQRVPDRDWSPVPGVDLLAFTLPLAR